MRGRAESIRHGGERGGGGGGGGGGISALCGMSVTYRGSATGGRLFTGVELVLRDGMVVYARVVLGVRLALR